MLVIILSPISSSRFDCGSGSGVLRSPEPVRLGHWNTISVYRHRWDAWLRLNNGKRVRGRSKVKSPTPVLIVHFLLISFFICTCTNQLLYSFYYHLYCYLMWKNKTTRLQNISSNDKKQSGKFELCQYSIFITKRGVNSFQFFMVLSLVFVISNFRK